MKVLPILPLIIPLIATELWGIDSRFLLSPEELRGVTSATALKDTAHKERGAASTPTPPQSMKPVRVVRTSPPPVKPPHRIVSSRKKRGVEGGKGSVGRHDLRLNGAPTESPMDSVTPLLEVWPRIAGPGSFRRRDPLSIERDDFSLRFDPSRYPVLETADGRRILLDTAGTIPPLVQSLVASVDPSVRIVSEDPSNRARFLSALLASGGFYSVEENFRFSSGDDPQITVYADFKVERKQESLMRQEIVLVNHNQHHAPYSPALQSFLATRGFTVVEPYGGGGKGSPGKTSQGTLRLLSGSGGVSVADGILDAMGVSYARDARLDLLTSTLDGVDLTVRTDRSFTLDGVPCVIGFFRGDPVAYTLMRLLETRGYRVVMLNEKDSFQDASLKIINSLRIPGLYGFREIQLSSDSPFSLSLTGIHLPSPGRKGGGVVVTDRKIDPDIIRVLEEAGYRVIQ